MALCYINPKRTVEAQSTWDKFMERQTKSVNETRWSLSLKTSYLNSWPNRLNYPKTSLHECDVSL